MWIRRVRFATDSSLEGDGFELFAGGRWIRTFGSWSRDRQTVMGDGTAFSKTEADLFGNRKFESISLQRGVDCEPDFRGRILSMTVGPFFFL